MGQLDPAPDHLGDLIHRQEELIGEEQELLQEMKDRDVWIDEQYGPLSAEYGERAARGEYDPRSQEFGYYSSDHWKQLMKDAEAAGDLSKARAFKGLWRSTQKEEYPQYKKIRGTPTMTISEFQQENMDPAGEGDRGQSYPESMSEPDEFSEQAYKIRRNKIRGPLLSLQEFQKAWADPNRRPQLKRLKAIYDPKLRRVIPLHYNLKAHDPGKYPDPIDIHGYADQHAGVMLRLVPEIHGLAPKDLENMNPYRPGYVMLNPKGSLVEIQAKYPQHQWDNDVMPRMIQDPTNEIDLRHGRIVRRGKANIATNIFIDRDNS